MNAPFVESLLRAGGIFYVRSAHPDAEEDYELRLAADGACEVDYVLPDLAADAFRAVFRPEAMTGGDALLAVTQTNPYARQNDEEYGGDGQPRRYTFRRTTPAFLLSEQLRALVRGRRPVSLHFYDFLDQGPAVELAFVSESAGTIDIDGKLHPIRIVRYEGDERDRVLELIGDTGLVRSVSRMGEEYEMRLLKIRTGNPSEGG